MSTLFPLQITIYFQLAINYKKIGGSAEMEEKTRKLGFNKLCDHFIYPHYFDNMEKELKKSR